MKGRAVDAGVLGGSALIISLGNWHVAYIFVIGKFFTSEAKTINTSGFQIRKALDRGVDPIHEL